MNADEPLTLMLFPEMDPAADVPEVTEPCRAVELFVLRPLLRAGWRCLQPLTPILRGDS